MREYLPVLQKSALFAGVDEKELTAMLGCLSPKKAVFRKDEYILRAGEPAKGVGLLLQGSALVIQEDFWGNRNIITALCPGEMFAEAFACAPGQELTVSVVAEQPGSALFLDIEKVMNTCSGACIFHKRMIRNFLAALAEKNLRMNEKLGHMSKRSTREKLLSYLSAQAQRGGSAEFDIPFNRQQLADYLSVDRSAMSAELGRLRDQGILRYDRSHFCLLAGETL